MSGFNGGLCGDRLGCLSVYMTPMVGLGELSVPTPMLVS